MPYKFEAGKTYKTRDNADVIIHTTRGRGRRPIIGEVRIGRKWCTKTWYEGGTIYIGAKRCASDLMPPRHEIYAWEAHEDGLCVVHYQTAYYASNSRDETKGRVVKFVEVLDDE